MWEIAAAAAVLIAAHGRGAGERARRAVRPRRLALKPGRVLIGDLAEKSCVGLVRTEALLLDVAQGGLVHAVGAPPVRVAVLVLVRAPPGLRPCRRSALAAVRGGTAPRAKAT